MHCFMHEYASLKYKFIMFDQKNYIYSQMNYAFSV